MGEMKSYVSSLPFQVQRSKMERGEHVAPKVEDPNVVTIKTEEEVWVDDVEDEELVSVGEDGGVVVDGEDSDDEGEGESNGTADDNNNDGRPGGKTKTEKKRAYNRAHNRAYKKMHRDHHTSKERLRRMALKIDFDQLKEQVLYLRDLNKASTTVILNKAADYARLLGHTELVLANERERVAGRNAELRQMLESVKMEYFKAQNKAFEYIHHEI